MNNNKLLNQIKGNIGMQINFEERDIDKLAEIVSNYIIAKLQSKRFCLLEPEDKYFTIDEAANFMGKSKGQIYQWVNKTRHDLLDFPYMKAGKSLKFSRNELIKWMKTNGKFSAENNPPQNFSNQLD